MKHSTRGCLLLLLIIPSLLMANVSLPKFISNHMVLQRNAHVKLWGWAKPDEPIAVTCSWNKQTVKTLANNQAYWSVTIQTGDAGGPYSMTIQGYNTIEISDILLGEVWFCSGQSNMEWSARMGFNHSEDEVKKANSPTIRFFNTYHRTAIHPIPDADGTWEHCTPETMIDFSAVAYLFAKKLQQELNVPIGLINASWGGTPAEAWTPESLVMKDPTLRLASKKIAPMEWGPHEPGRIYNAMVAPFAGLKMAGVIWYQGETNTANAESYARLFTTMITSWREAWNEPLPFYYAQIAPYNDYGKNYSGVIVRDQQRRALALANTGMIVTSDIGDTSNIHPGNKQDVALRLASIALNNLYGKKENAVSGPLYKSVLFENNNARVLFDHAQGLHFKGEDAGWFEIAGADKKYVKAKSVIEGESIIVSSENISEPKFIRFAWSNTATPNLFNGKGLPASSFTNE